MAGLLKKLSSFFHMTGKDVRGIVLNALIGALIVVVAYLLLAFLQRTFFRPPVETSRLDSAGDVVIQIDVLNGCGDPGIAAKCSAFLRSRGYDVVEMRNYKTFDVEHSMVIDRVGNLQNAERVAYALGVGKDNVIQQINHDYYVDVSVVIGADYRTLRPFN
jgi:hypothetical protein